MLVTMATSAGSFRKVPSLSSASTTIQSPAPEPRVGAIGVDDAAIDHGRVEAAGIEQGRDHRGRGGLAVGAGDRDAAASAASARPASRRGAPPACAARAPPSSSGLSRLIAVETTTTSAPSRFSALWPIDDRDALVAQALDVGAFGRVGALHRVAEIAQHLGDAAHADAADADEVDGADLARQSHALFPRSSPPYAGRSSIPRSAKLKSAARQYWMPRFRGRMTRAKFPCPQPIPATFTTRSASRPAASRPRTASLQA